MPTLVAESTREPSRRRLFGVSLMGALLALSGGLVVSLGIAWLGAATSVYRRAPTVYEGGLPSAVSSRGSVTWSAPLSEYVNSYRRDVYECPFELPILAAPPWWLPLDWSVARRGLSADLHIEEEAHGFPLRCLCTRFDDRLQSLYSWGRPRLPGERGDFVGIAISEEDRKVPRCEPPEFIMGSGTRRIRPRSLPLIPLPLGLTVDTLFWGALLAPATRGVQWGVRTNRRRLGLCAIC